MKVIVSVLTILTFIISGILSPNGVHAGKGDPPVPGDTVVILALIGGAAYLGYHYSQHYEVKKKAAVEIKDGKMKLQQPTLHVITTTKESVLMASQDQYSLNLISVKF